MMIFLVLYHIYHIVQVQGIFQDHVNQKWWYLQHPTFWMWRGILKPPQWDNSSTYARTDILYTYTVYIDKYCTHICIYCRYRCIYIYICM